MSFDHRAHLELAWNALSAHGLGGAMQSVPAHLATLAAQHGAPGKYHETLTLGWLLLLADRKARHDGCIDEVLREFPELLDPRCVHTIYGDAIDSDAAKTRFTLPRGGLSAFSPSSPIPTPVE